MYENDFYESHYLGGFICFLDSVKVDIFRQSEKLYLGPQHLFGRKKNSGT